MSSPNCADPAYPASELSTATRHLFDESALVPDPTPRVASRSVAALLDEHYGVVGDLVRVDTEKDDTFRLRSAEDEVLVKVSSPHEPAGVVALHTAVMAHLADHAPDLPTQRIRTTRAGHPHVLLHSRQGPRILRVFGFVDGDLLADNAPGRERLAETGEVLARLDHALATFRHPAEGRRLVWDLRHLLLLEELTERVAGTAERRRLAGEVFGRFRRDVVVRFDELPVQMIHGDFSPFNVIVDRTDGNVAGVIDFGDCVRSATVFDPVVMASNLLDARNPDPWADAGTFVAGFCRRLPLGAAESSVLVPATLSRLLQRALVHGWRAARMPDRRDYLVSHAADDWTTLQAAVDTAPGRLPTGRSDA